MNFNLLLSTYAITVLRIVMGIIFITHGAARFYYSSIEGFGSYLDSKGFVIGLILAWIVTLGEIIGGALLVSGFFVRYAIVFHAIVIITGLVLIHIPNGWFVVGHGTGGVEFSLLILAVLLVLFTQNKRPQVSSAV